MSLKMPRRFSENQEDLVEGFLIRQAFTTLPLDAGYVKGRFLRSSY